MGFFEMLVTTLITMVAVPIVAILTVCVSVIVYVGSVALLFFGGLLLVKIIHKSFKESRKELYPLNYDNTNDNINHRNYKIKDQIDVEFKDQIVISYHNYENKQ